MKIVLDGKRAGRRRANKWIACYFESAGHFTRMGLSQHNILHEFFHHVISVKEIELSERHEEREAEYFASNFKEC